MKISDFRTAQIAQGYGVQKTGASPDAKSKKIGGAMPMRQPCRQQRKP